MNETYCFLAPQFCKNGKENLKHLCWGCRSSQIPAHCRQTYISHRQPQTRAHMVHLQTVSRAELTEQYKPSLWLRYKARDPIQVLLHRVFLNQTDSSPNSHLHHLLCDLEQMVYLL